jgi:RNA polymerase sigma-70 factor (ECF subfamily)
MKAQVAERRERIATKTGRHAHIIDELDAVSPRVALDSFDNHGDSAGTGTVAAMETPTSSFGLVERIQHGDKEAFTRLFEKYSRRLAVLIHYKLSPERREVLEVDDILQGTLFKAFRDIDTFTYRSPGSFLRWLSAIADHVIIDEARFQSRQRRHAEVLAFRSPSNPQGAEPADSKTPSRLLGERQSFEALMDRLNALPEDYRQVIVLAKIEGLTTAEIAEQLGKSREAVALLLHRAIKRFRALTQQPSS